MKPFNLEQAKKGHPVCTRDGKPARILAFDLKGDYPICAAVDAGGNNETPIRYTYEGMFYMQGSSSNDLMMASVKHEGWVNVYLGEYGHFLSREIWSSEDEALKHSHEGTRVATIKIEWEE